MLRRRQFLHFGAAAIAASGLGLSARPGASDARQIQRPIPGSGESIPVIGMGTSRTFDVDASDSAVAPLREVMAAFFEAGGSVIDSSPMYGKAEARVGDILRDLDPRPPVFAATKVWTRGREEGIAQMEQSSRRMAVERFDLIAVHNLVDWRTHLDTLRRWKDSGKVRYIGITTSHGRDHTELLEIMRREPLDFVQFSYNIDNRVAEEALLPTAAERGIATMINRPYQRGSLFGLTRDKALPEMAAAIDCSSWGQFFLKFILGHPAVTCIIPATSKARHMRDNMQAGFGKVPDSAEREEMLRIFRSLRAEA
jgi:diketogulonate reductase-like aldo/keto reductase